MSSFDEESMDGKAQAAEIVAEGVAEDADCEEAPTEATVEVVDEHDNHDYDTVAHGDDDESMAQAIADDETTVKSERTAAWDDEEALSQEVGPKKKKSTTSSHSNTKRSPKRKASLQKSRSPAIKGLTIPFRAIKRTMKLDQDVATVQNESAILVTLAAELFVTSLAKESFQNAKRRGRATIRYEDVAEARTKKPSLAFLEPLLP